MTRVALALAAILLLACSAGQNQAQLQQLPFSRGQLADAGLLRSSMAAGANVTLPHARSPEHTIRPTPDEAPAPALLIYLALIVVGSAVAVGLVRHSQRRQIL
jgi:hypothetical protein